MRSFRSVACGMSLVAALTLCGAAQSTQPLPIERIEATPETIEKARADLQRLADRDRRTKAALSFEEFEATVYKERIEDGKYIVNGDTTIASRKQLREFYEENVRPAQSTKLIMAQVGSLDAKWSDQQKRQLSYCVSSAFGSRKPDVIQQMEAATGAWEKVAAVHFVHDAAQDGSCGPANANVVFDVRPVNLGRYLARAFFPNEPRAARNVLIDDSSFGFRSDEKLQLVGILRHELGHTLGWRHEQTRPESGACFEDKDWRPLTSYDAFSVMHYPQCNGKGDWSLVLTDKDKNASACVYGAAAGFTIDKTLVTTACATESTPAGEPRTETFNGLTVAKGAEKPYGPFSVTPNTPLEIAIGGSGAAGDPDLYVRFAGKPSTTEYDCRPFTEGPNEVCSVTVPSNATRVFVRVRGYEQGTYDLRVTRVPPAAGSGRGGH